MKNKEKENTQKLAIEIVSDFTMLFVIVWMFSNSPIINLIGFALLFLLFVAGVCYTISLQSEKGGGENE